MACHYSLNVHEITMYWRTCDKRIWHKTYCTTWKISPYMQFCTAAANPTNSNWVFLWFEFSLIRSNHWKQWLLLCTYARTLSHTPTYCTARIWQLQPITERQRFYRKGGWRHMETRGREDGRDRRRKKKRVSHTRSSTKYPVWVCAV